jgi:chaperonin GroEL
MSKILAFDHKARKYLLEGVSILSKAVKVTFGPKGKMALIRKNQEVISTKDGVTVAKEIFLQNSFANTGACLLKDAAIKMQETVGDGSTTVIILAEKMIQEGLKYIAAGVSPILLKKGLEKALSHTLSFLSDISIEIKTKKEIEKIATLAAHNDPFLGKIVREAIEKVGNKGIIHIEKSQTTKTRLHLVKGMHFSRGYLSPYFVTHREKMTVEFSHTSFLLVHGKISSGKDLVSLLKKFAEKLSGSLLIIAEDIEPEALSTIVINKIKMGYALCAVKIPGIDEEKKELLEDIAILTGAKIIDKNTELASINTSFLGKAKKVTISKETTTIIDGYGNKKDIETRKKQIQNQLQTVSLSKYAQLEARYANLSGKIVEIKLGALSDTEFKEKKICLENALSSTKAALRQGVVPGGGVSLIRAAQNLSSLNLEEKEHLGISIMKQACMAVTKVLAENRGKEGSVVVEKIMRSPKNFGYNVVTDSFTDLLKEKVLDPVYVLKNALVISSSICSMFITTSVIAVNTDKKYTE